jgi:hypothetical protein
VALDFRSAKWSPSTDVGASAAAHEPGQAAQHAPVASRAGGSTARGRRPPRRHLPPRAPCVRVARSRHRRTAHSQCSRWISRLAVGRWTPRFDPPALQPRDLASLGPVPVDVDVDVATTDHCAVARAAFCDMAVREARMHADSPAGCWINPIGTTD